MNIKETFLKLTKKTYPHGTERKLRGMLPKGHEVDKNGNYFLKIGESKTIFACHLDTVSKDEVVVNHVIENNIIKTDGESILGADDKAGMTILLYMISKRIPGTYYFFIGEEVGCIGSKAAVKDEDFSKYERIISFDRRDICSIITHQSYRRCCSDDFANALSAEYTKLGLELKPDDTGVGTDSAQFISVISECTNISVGYYKEHTHEESQDIEFLEKLCIASTLVNWESLPSSRDKKLTQWKEYKSNYNYNYNNNYNNYNNGGRNRAYGWNNTNRRYQSEEEEDEYNFRTDYNSYDEFYRRNPNFDDEAPIDNAIEQDRRRKRKPKNNRQYNLAKTDIYHPFKNYLSDKYISPEDYAIIEEQYIDSWLL